MSSSPEERALRLDDQHCLRYRPTPWDERVFGLRTLSITIADERALSRKRSPFRTLESLAAYVDELLQEQRAV